jgi:hypothetical protein
MKKDIVWRLLRRNLSIWQTAGYALANFAGLAIVMCAVKFYCDVRSGNDGDDPYVTRDYLVISKSVGTIGGLLGNDNSFSPEDIAELSGQPWCKRIGAFTSADFNVSASLAMGGRGLSTNLFLESVPDEFFDVKPSQWSFTPGQDTTVPIILSKDYLTLYNYGFAASAGLPQISESVVSMVPIRLSVSGNGKQQWLRGKVVGFSSRLNTIAVPTDFITWANSEFGEGNPANPGRLILETTSPGNPDVDKFLADHKYEVAGDKGASGKAAYFLSVTTAVVAGIGIVICLLAFAILMLSIWLLLQKNRDKLHSLMLLGYTPAAIRRYYFVIVGGVNLLIFIAATAVTLCVAPLWRVPLEAIGLDGASSLTAIAVGAAVTVAVTAINFSAIAKKVRSAFPG